MLDEDYYSCKCGYEVSVLDVLNKLVKLESCYVPSTKEVICGECGSKHEKSIQIKKLKCPECSGLMEEKRVKDVVFEGVIVPGKTIQIMGAQYKKPIHSDSLGLMPNQVAEHKEKFPYIPIDSENRPVFTNKTDHEKYMKECGIIKIPSSNKPKRKYFTKTGDN